MALITCTDCKSEFSNEAKACPKCGKPRPKANYSFMGVSMLGLLAFVSYQSCSGGGTKDSGPTPVVQAMQRAAQVEKDDKARLVASCKASLDTKRAAYAAALDAGKYWDARMALEDCPTVLNDPDLLKMRAGADRLHYITTAGNAKATASERISAIDGLKIQFPDDYTGFSALHATLVAAEVKRGELATKRAEAAEKARKRKEGVSLGMSPEDVRASSWGRPNKINRSTYSFGVHEQWVYDGGYLYFQNGVLTSIQN